MSKRKFSLTQTLNKKIPPDEFKDLIEDAINDVGRLISIEGDGESGLRFKAAAKDANHGIKGSASIAPAGGDASTFTFEGKVVTTDWFWPIFHVILTLMTGLYALIGVWLILKSQKKAQEMPEAILRQMRRYTRG